MIRQKASMKKLMFGGNKTSKRMSTAPGKDEARPAKDQLDKMYKQLLEELAIPESKRDAMLNDDDDRKWDLIKMHSAMLKNDVVNGDSDAKSKKRSALYWVEVMQKRKTSGEPLITVDEAGELLAVIRTSHKQFLIDFIEQEGVEYLVELTRWFTGRANKQAAEKRILSQLISCYKALMNNNIGMEGVLQTQDAITSFAYGMDLSDETDLSMAQEVVMILAVTCFYSPHGRELVLDAMDSLRLAWREQKRFQTLVETFAKCDDNEFRAAVIMFITTIVNSSSEVSDRVRVRNDFLALDILRVFERVLDDAKEEAKEEGTEEAYTTIATQYQVFEDMTTEDHKEVVYNLISGTPTGTDGDVDLSNQEEVFEFLNKSAQTAGCSDLLLDLSQSLLLIPTARSLAVPTWEAVTQFVREATDYARRRGAKGIRLNYQLLSELLDKRAELDDRLSQATSGDDIIGNQRKKIQELQKKIDQLKKGGAKGGSKSKGGSSNDVGGGGSEESSEEVGILQDQVKQLRDEIASLQKKLAAGSKGKPIEDDVVEDDTSAAVPASFTGKLDSTGLRPAGLVPGVKSVGIPPCPMPNMKGSLELAPIPTKSGAKTKGAPKPSGGGAAGGAGMGAVFDMLKNRGPPASSSNQPAGGAKGAAAAAIASRAAAAPPTAPKLSPKETEEQIRKKLGLPAKKAINPNVKMRNIFWTPVPVEKLEGTVWPNLSDQKVKFSVKQLEKKFGDKKSDEDQTKKAGDPKRKSNGTVHLVTGKRQQNVGIAISKIRASEEEIVQAIWTLDEIMLNLGHTQVLLTTVPTEDEIELINNFENTGGNPKKLAREDKFLRAISKIPRLNARLSGVLTKFNFESDYERIFDKITIVRKACVEIDRSQELHKLLEIVLALGNYLNGGTARGAVWGFKLDALAKLDQVKDNTNKGTLMDFLYQVIETNYPALVKFRLIASKDASDVSLSDTMTELNQLASAVRSIKSELEHPPANKHDKFQKLMTGFEVKASKRVQDLQTEFEKVRTMFQSLASQYAETGAGVEPETFFPKFVRFEVALQRAKRAVEEKREREERARRLAAEKERMKTLKKLKELEANGADDSVFAAFAKAHAGNAEDIVQGFLQRHRGSGRETISSSASRSKSSGGGSSDDKKKKKKKKVKIVQVVGPNGEIIEKRMKKKKKKKPPSSVPNADYDIA